MMHLLECLFQIRNRGGNIGSELIGGVTLFIGSAFSLVSTSIVLAACGVPFVDGVVACAWANCIGNILVGLLSNLPIAVNAGAGPNFTVVYVLARSVASGGLGSYRMAMVNLIVSGLMIVLLTIIGAISFVTNVVPNSFKLAICVGIGLLCAFVGMQLCAMVVKSEQGLVGPGEFSSNPQIWLTLFGILGLTLLNARRIKGSILLTMILVTLIDWSLVDGWPPLALTSFELPKLYMVDLEPHMLLTINFWAQALAMVMMLVFDGMGCLFGLARLAGRVSEGRVEGGNGFFYALGLGTSLAAVCGATPLVVSGSSAGAIIDGARTGLSTCICGVLFVLIGLPFAKVVEAMPPCASSFVLIYTGASLAADAKGIEWDDPIEAIPAFLCLISQPFLFSIADGIGLGLVTAFVLSFLSGRMFASNMIADVRSGQAVELETPVSDKSPFNSRRPRALSLPEADFHYQSPARFVYEANPVTTELMDRSDSLRSGFAPLLDADT